MSDDDFTTLLDLDEGGFHAGGTVRLGSRPLAVASGGLTLNPPDLAAVREGLHGLTDRLQGLADDPGAAARDAMDAIRHALADPAEGLDHAREAVGGELAALTHRLPTVDASALAQRLPSVDAAALARRAAEITGRSTRRRTLVERLPTWLPATVALTAMVAAGGVVAWLWHPEHGAARRRRLVAMARDRWEAIGAGRAERDLVAIPIEVETAGGMRSPEAEVSASA